MGIWSTQPQSGGTDILKFINDFIANASKIEDNKQQKTMVQALRRIQKELKQQKKIHKHHLIVSVSISTPLSAVFGYVLCTFV